MSPFKNSPDIEVLLNKYKNKSPVELSDISPKWAYGVDSCHIYDIALRPGNKEFSFFTIEISSILQFLDFYEVKLEPLFTGKPLNDERVARILWRWENKMFTDPPSISISSSSKPKITFYDGRHRFKANYHLKQERIPVFIHNDDIDKFNQLIQYNF